MNVRDQFGPFKLEVNGLMVGVELEFEADDLPRHDFNRSWLLTDDGSLRQPSGEYVLKKPLPVDGAKAAIGSLYKEFVRSNTKIHDSVRAGVHVHVNVQDLEIRQLYTMMTLYLMFEELLVEWCGDSRVGNLFCLRAADAGELTYIIAKAAKTGYFRQMFRSDEVRYGSMNVKALTSYGSLEFRAMRSTKNPEDLYTWIDLLTSVREAALKFDSPQEVVESYSLWGAVDFVKRVFGKDARHLLKLGDIEAKVFSGMRSAQEVAYAVNWDDVKAQEVYGNNPFDIGMLGGKTVGELVPLWLVKVGNMDVPERGIDLQRPQQKAARPGIAIREDERVMRARAAINADMAFKVEAAAVPRRVRGGV